MYIYLSSEVLQKVLKYCVPKYWNYVFKYKLGKVLFHNTNMQENIKYANNSELQIAKTCSKILTFIRSK